MKKIAFFTLLLTSFIFCQAQSEAFDWVRGIGGSNVQCFPGKIVVDANNNVYTVGGFSDGITVGNTTLNSVGSDDVFITKHDASGNLIYAKSVGGTASDVGMAVSTDAFGNVYVVGSFRETMDANPGNTNTNLTSKGGDDIFILKLTAAGDFVWAKSIGGAIGDVPTSVANDSNGKIYVTGIYIDEVDFDPGSGISTLNTAGAYHIFVLKLDTDGNYEWAKGMGTNTNNLNAAGNSIAADGMGNVYVAGHINGNVAFGPTTLSCSGFFEAFVSKIDTDGNFIWAKSIGGTDSDVANGVAVDATGNVFVTGSFAKTADLDPGTGTFIVSTPNNAAASNAYILKLDTDGDFVWGTSIGSTSNDIGNHISTDAAGNVYTIGTYLATVDFDPANSIFNLSSAGQADVFISKLTNNGDFLWAGSIGSIQFDNGVAIDIDGAGNIYTMGSFREAFDADPSSANNSLAPTGDNDIFLVKLKQGNASIENITEKENINVFPNPNTGAFQVNFGETLKDAQLMIYNSTGQIVYQSHVYAKNQLISLENTSSGVYYLQVKTAGNIQANKKLIIQK